MAETAAQRYAREWGNHTANANGDNRKTRGLDNRGGTYDQQSPAVASTTGTKSRKNVLFVDENGNTAVS